MNNDNTFTSDYYTPVLCVAGSDPSGGAGLQADLKTCEAFGCYGMAVVSALTAQSPRLVTSVRSVSDFMQAQLDTLLDEARPAAVKTGMLPDVRAVEAVSEAIDRYDLRNVTVDPVMVSTSGHALTDSSYAAALTALLLPRAVIITPNVPEAEILAGINISDTNDCRHAAEIIATRYGCHTVLIKGGHINGPTSTDLLYIAASDTFHTFTGTRIETSNTHGTGCRLSTAIACGLALGHSVTESIDCAKKWLEAELRRYACHRFPSPSHHKHL